MKALMTLGLVCGFTVLTGADALAKPGKGATSTIKTEDTVETPSNAGSTETSISP